MVTFKYDLNQDTVELQASNWCGLEQIFLNGRRVSRKLNFGRSSEHHIELEDGNPCRFQLVIDPSSDELVCHIYQENSWITSLKQEQAPLVGSKARLQNLLLFISFSALLMLLIN